MKKYSKYFIIGFILIILLASTCFIPIKTERLIPLIEEQVEKDLGIKIHIERLILRLGPSIKLKAPIMHLMYDDGQKFAQFDNAKFYISWYSLIKNSPHIKQVNAKKLTLRLASDDKQLSSIIEKIKNKNYNETPKIHLKEYRFSYHNKANSDNYILEGNFFNFDKISTTKSYRVKTSGNFNINSQKFITYDIIFAPESKNILNTSNINMLDFIEQMKDLDFHSDIIADIKLYKAPDKTTQASGFINIDNISVLDRALKNPKSFIYLTLWGDKASILSNIYTSPNKKVYIEGMINNSLKPILDLKVKTDDISIDDLYQKIKIFSDFSQIKNIKSINGTLSANFTLKGDLNKIKSNGYLKILNAGIKADGLEINNINSDIDFSNNAINIINTVGYVNNSPIIIKGKIDKEIDLELLMDKIELKYLTPSNYGVQNGLISLIGKINGTLNKIEHKENLSLEKLKILNNNFSLDIDSIKIDTNKNQTAYINNVICKHPEIELIKIPSMQVLIDTERIKVPDTNVFMPNSKMVLKGEFINYNTNEMNFSTNLNGYINSRDIKRFATNSSRYPLVLNFSGNKTSQNINSQVLLEKTDLLEEPTIVNLIGKLEKNSLKLEDLSLVSFTGDFSNDQKSNLKGTKKLILSGNIDNFKKPILKNIRVFIPQQLSLHFCDTLLQIKGDLFVNGELKTPDIIGQLFIQNLVNQAVQLSLQNCTLDFNKNNFVFNAPFIKLADSTLGLNALISTDISKEFVIKNVNIKSKYLNTDTLLMYKDLDAIKDFPIKINDGKFYAERLLANLYNSSMYLTGFTCDFKLANEILNIKNIVSEIFNGKINGTIDYNLKDEHFSSKLMGRNISAEPIFSIISPKKETINGAMDFDSEIKGELTSKQSLNGNIKFIVNNGRMSTLGKLEHLLYAQNVIADSMLRTSLSVITRAITLKDTGLFKYLRGDIDLENGLVNIKMIQSQGPLMALFIKGIYNPQTDFANLTILGRLSDEIISGLGAFGDFSFNKLMIMLTGEEKTNNVIIEDIEKIPQLNAKYTKEFRSIINGLIDKPSSVVSFNWISYSQKSLRQKDVPIKRQEVPEFVEKLPY